MRTSFPLLLCVVACGLARGQDDPVQAKLAEAQKKYDAATAKYRDDAAAYFDKREDAARKAGNIKLVEQIKGERAAFEKTDVLPAGAPLAIKQGRTNAAKSLEEAFTAAAKEFLKAKKDSQADLAEKNAACLKQYGVVLPEWGATFPPGMYALIYANKDKDRALLEIRPNGTFSRNKEGKDFTHGTFELRDGKLVLKSETYVTVVSAKDGQFAFAHFFPAKEYPGGKSASGAMARIK